MAQWLKNFGRRLCLVVATGLASWQTNWQERGWADEPGSQAIPSPLAEEAIEEILRLRRLLGTDEALPGINRGGGAATPDDQFRQALRALIERPAAAEPVVASPVPPDPPVPPRSIQAERLTRPVSETPRRLVRSRVQRSAALDDQTTLDSADADLIVVGSLRDTSRLLDNRAHDLDLEQRFDEAQRLRQLAARLRKDARRIEATVPSHENGFAPR